MDNLFLNARKASRTLLSIDDETRSRVIITLAELIERNQTLLLEANRADLSRMNQTNPLYDRLQLSPERLHAIACDARHVAALPSQVGEVIEQRQLPNGIDLRKIRVPFGVIGVIYESRPNVTFDVFALCLKSGNATILKGGKDADSSNQAAIKLIHQALHMNGVSESVATLLPSTHESTLAMLEAVGYVDVCIPRGGRQLIDFVRNNAKVPVIETGAGVVHIFFDLTGNKEIGKNIIANAKTRRVSVCNSLDTLLIHRDRLSDLPYLLEPLANKEVVIFADEESFNKLIESSNYPHDLIHIANNECWDTEWMDYKMGIHVVGSIDEAITHISHHGSGHSESIISEDRNSINQFKQLVDASCVYINLPTSFTDGGQFGLGAEIGISTQKLGPRGPMGLREITTTRYVLEGHGQTRP